MDGHSSRRRFAAGAAAGPCAVALAAALVARAALGGDALAYMVVDLASGAVSYESGEGSDYSEDAYKTTKMVLRRIPAGTEYYVQGGTAKKADISQDYYIGIYEVTVGQYELMCDRSAVVAASEANMLPKTGVSYVSLRGTDQAGSPATADSPLGRMSAASASSPAPAFDLPSDAMWEVAARAMPSGDDACAWWQWFFGATADLLGDYAWYEGSSGGSARAVGGKLPNAWGLYDMYGNAREWCLDHYHWQMTISQGGNASVATLNRVVRGGGFRDSPQDCSSDTRHAEYRGNAYDDLGFRVAALAVPQADGGDSQPAVMSGQATITEWRKAGDVWKLSFTVPCAGMVGEADRLEPDKSFSVRFCTASLTNLCAAPARGEENGGYLDFEIESAEVSGDDVAVSLTLHDERLLSSGSVFVRIVPPRAPPSDVP